MYRIILLQLFLTLSLTNLTAQEPSAHSDWNLLMQEMSFLGSRDADGTYRLGPGDLLEITVFGVDDFNRSYRISESNAITMPHLGKVSTEKMTGEELERSIAHLLTDNDLVKDPLVSVFIKEYRSQPVYVLGAVGTPGQYMITHQISLIDVLTMAGGVDQQRASNFALVQRPAGLENSTKTASDDHKNPDAPLDQDANVLRIDLEAILKQGDLSLNIPVRGGDIIHVPPRRVEYYYVVGDVTRPGVFELPIDEDDSELLLTHAVAKAGGPAKTAKMSDGILVRYDENGERQELAVDFNAILRGRRSDPVVQPNDIIFIPGSKFKTIGYGLLGIIPQTVTRTATQGIY
jgi:polysaccharide biosynthesis/export protein